MTVALLLLGATLTILGATFEVSLLSVTRIRLADMVSLRLRGGEEPLTWPSTVSQDLMAASTLTTVGVVVIGGALPGLATGVPVWQVLLGLFLLAVPITLVSSYFLPRWLSHARAEHAIALIGPMIKPWSTLLRLVFPRGKVEDDLRSLTREGAIGLPEDDAEMAMVGGAITFAERPVREVMTPRTDVVAVEEGTSVTQIAAVFAESGYSRIPVYRETLDQIVGMLHAFDLFSLREGDALEVRPVTLTPGSRACADLLLDMQRERRHLAVVLDEFGGTLGIVTLEDLLTALVGEIQDEGSEASPEPRAEILLLESDGSQEVSDVEERLGVTFTPGHATTIGGRLAEWLGRIPVTGERLVVGEIEFDILRASPARVERVVIRRRAPIPVVLPEGAQ